MRSAQRGDGSCQFFCCEAGPPGEGSMAPVAEKPQSNMCEGPLRPLHMVARSRVSLNYLGLSQRQAGSATVNTNENER